MTAEEKALKLLVDADYRTLHGLTYEEILSSSTNEEEAINTYKSVIIKDLRLLSTNIYKYNCLGIDKDETDPSFKINDYLQKYEWAADIKKQIINGELNIDYSSYHDHAVRFKGLCQAFNISETDVDKAYVDLIILLSTRGKKNLAIITENVYKIKDTIKNASSETELKDIISNFDSNLKIGLIL